MRFKKIAAGLCLQASALCLVSTPSYAAINTTDLGVAYNAGATSLTFNVFAGILPASA